MKKRIFSAFLAICLTLTLLPISAMAEEAAPTGEPIISDTPTPTEEPTPTETPAPLVVTALDPLSQSVYEALCGTDAASLGLPDTLSAQVLRDGETVQVSIENVIWLCADYDGNTAGDYTFTAYAEGYAPAEGVEWPSALVTIIGDLPPTSEEEAEMLSGLETAPDLLTAEEVLSAAPELAPRLLRAAVRSVTPTTNPGTYFTGVDNENNAGTGVADGDMDTTIGRLDSRYPIEATIEIPSGMLPTQSAYLAVRTFDVDWTSGEYDRLYINGRFVAPLTGLNNQWNTSFYTIPLSYLHEGTNTVLIDIGHLSGGNTSAKFGLENTAADLNDYAWTWVVAIDWMQLVCDGGSRVGVTQYAIDLIDAYLSGGEVMISAQTTITGSGSAYSTEYSITDSDGYIVGSYQGSGVSGNESFAISMPADSASGIYTIQAMLKTEEGAILANDSVDFEFTQDVGALIGPKLSYTLDPSGLTNQNVTITVSVTDANGFTEVSIPVSTQTATVNGDYDFTYSFKDVTGTTHTQTYTVKVTGIDKTSPVIEYIPLSVLQKSDPATAQDLFAAALSVSDDSGRDVGLSYANITADMLATGGTKTIVVTATDHVGNTATKNCTLTVTSQPLTINVPTTGRVGSTASFNLSATLAFNGGKTITETGFVWGAMQSPTLAVNHGSAATSSPVTTEGGVVSAQATGIVSGVNYYVRAYAKVGETVYYSEQASFGISAPSYGVFTVTNSANSFTISRTGGSDGAQTVYYRTVNGSAVNGTHFTGVDSSVAFAAGETSKTVTITENAVTSLYGSNAATAYSNADRIYWLEIYRVDGGATLGTTTKAQRTMTMNASYNVDKSIYDYIDLATYSGGTVGVQEKIDNVWSKTLGISLSGTPFNSTLYSGNTRTYLDSTASAMKVQLKNFSTYDDGWSMLKYVLFNTGAGNISLGSDKNGTFSTTPPVITAGTTKCALIFGRENKDSTAPSTVALPQDVGVNLGTFGGYAYTVRAITWASGQDGGDYVLFGKSETCYISIGGYNSAANDSKYSFTGAKLMTAPKDATEPQLLGVAPIVGTYKAGDSITISLIFNEIVDLTNSPNITDVKAVTNWGTFSYTGGANTNVLYFTGTVTAATSQLTLNSITNASYIKDLCSDTGASSATGKGSAGGAQNNTVPTVSITSNGISNGTATATITATNAGTLQYAWTQSAALPVSGWFTCASGAVVTTRQTSGTWYLHVLGAYAATGATAATYAAFNFGSESSPTSPLPALSVTVDGTGWATSRAINITRSPSDATVTYTGPTAGTASGSTLNVTQNGLYTFTLTSGGETVTREVTVSNIDTAAPILNLSTAGGASAVYHSLTMSATASDTLSGLADVVYRWTDSADAPTSGWEAATETSGRYVFTYTATETSQATKYLHVRATDNAGNVTDKASAGYTVIAETTAQANPPKITLTGAPTSWTRVPVSLTWTVTGGTSPCTVSLGGTSSTDAGGTISAATNGLYTVTVRDANGASAEADCLVNFIDAEAPGTGLTVSDANSWKPEKTVTLSGATDNRSAQYDASGNITGYSGSGIATQEWKLDGGSYTEFTGDSFSAKKNGVYTVRLTDAAGNSSEQSVTVEKIDAVTPTISVTGGLTGAASLSLSVASTFGTSGGGVAVSGAASGAVSATYVVSAAGDYTFTAASGAGLTASQTVNVYSITFDGNSGSTTAGQIVAGGGKAAKPADPTRDGYTFTGWQSGGAAFSFDTAITSNTTLTAQWTAIPATAPVIATHPANTTLTYGGITSSHTLSVSATAATRHTLSYQWYSSTSAVNTGGSVLSGANASSFAIPTDLTVGSYYYYCVVTATYTDNSLTANTVSSAATVTIGNAAITHSASGVTTTYDGAPHGITVSPSTVNSQKATVTYRTTASGEYNLTTNPTYTDAGTYTVYYQITAPNHAAVTGSETVTISAKEIAAVWNSTVSWVYDGSAHAPTATATTGVAGETVTLSVSGAKANYSAKAYTATASIQSVAGGQAKAANYALTNTTKEFSITQLTAELSWDYTAAFTYDGTEKSVSATVNNLKSQNGVTDACAVTVSGDTQTNADSYRATATELSNPNYKLPSNVTLDYVITPAPLTVSTANSLSISKVYDGNTTVKASDVTDGLVVNGLIGSESAAASGTWAYADAAVGTGKTVNITGINISYDTATGSNYSYTYEALSTTGAITNAAITPNASGATTTYDGLPHGITVTPSTVNAQTATVIYRTTASGDYNLTTNPTFTDAGTYTVYYQITAPNHAAVTGSAAVTINPKALDAAMIAAIASSTYSGLAQTPTPEISWTPTGGSKLTLTAGETGDFTFSYSNNTEAALLAAASAPTVTVTAKTDGNYSGSASRTFTIDPATPTADSFSYTAPSNPVYTATGKAASVAGAQYGNYAAPTGAVTVKYAASNADASTAVTKLPTAVGSYKVYIDVAADGNFTSQAGITADAWTFTVTKAPVSFTVSNNSHPYDAKAHTATVVQTAGQVPAVGSGFSVSYKLPLDSSATIDKTDVGTYDVIVTLTDVNFKFAGQEDSVRSLKVGELSIGKISVTARWQNTTAVYDGSAKSPTLVLVGLETGDESKVSAQLSESKTEAGTYAVTAQLTGDKSANYTLTNPNGTLVIQKAPVSFSVIGDSVQYDGVSHSVGVTASANGSAFADYAVTYRNAGGENVVSPTDAGSYDVYAEITNTNYRHADATDGAARKIGVLTIYSSVQPAVHTLSFDGDGEDSGATAPLIAAQSGTPRILPDCGFLKAGSVFSGWSYGGKTYQPGESFTQPASDVTMTAVWTVNTYMVSGVVNQANQPLSNVVVTLMLGSVKLGETVTDIEGKYIFTGVAPSLYNLVASFNGIVQTELIELIDADESRNIVMPAGKTNSIVEVGAGSPPVVVGGLEDSFTPSEIAAASAGDTIEIKLSVNAVTVLNNTLEQQQIEDAAANVGLYLDVTLAKTVTDSSGTVRSELDESTVLLEIVISLPGELQGKAGYSVYRVHNGELQTLSTSPNADGEYIEVSADRTALTVYTKNFSAYAIGFTEYSTGSLYPVTIAKDVEHGAIKLDKTRAGKGERITITLIPDEGYEPVSLTVTDKDGNEIPVSQNDDGTYSVTQISGGVSVAALFRLLWNPFTDVSESDWFHDNVRYAYEKGLMQGTSETLFSPYSDTSRGMIVTILWRLENTPSAAESMSFTDVDEDSYYYEAIAWAAEHGIVEGFDALTFGPEKPITREQLAAILWRYAKYKEYDVSVGEDTNILSYNDAIEISEYAIPAIQWACGAGLMRGDNGNLMPLDDAQRCQVAAMLCRFCENVAR